MNANPGKMPGRLGFGRRWNVAVVCLGLVCLAVIAGLALRERPSLESDLARRAAGALHWTGETWAEVRFSGRDALVSGEALAEEARAKVRQVLAALPGVRRVIDQTTLLPERRPFTFSAMRDGRALQLSGYVPSAAARERITAAAQAMPGISQVRGQAELVRARGAPPGDFAEVVGFGLAQLGLLPTGRIILSDDAFAIEGRSPDLPTYEALSAIMHGPLPQGFRLARFAVRPPVVAPFMWSVLREGDELRILGSVPSEDARSAVLATLGSAIPDARLRDEMRLGDGAPATDLWLKAVAFGAAQLALLPKGRVLLTDTAVTLEGAAVSFEVFDALQAARRAPPEGFSITRFAVEPPRVSPFVWRAEREAERVRLSGFVVSEEAKRGLADAVRSLFPGVPVADETRIASGGPAPEAFAAAGRFALTQLSRMRLGEARLEGESLSLDGEALDAEALAKLATAAGAPPPGINVAPRFRPPFISPFVFAARRERQGLILSGFLPDAAAQSAVAKSLENMFPEEKVEDVAAVGSGAPAGFVEAVKAGLMQMVRLDPAELRLTGTELRLSGEALNAAAAQQIRDALATAVPAGFSVATEIAPVPPGAPLSELECLPLAAGFNARPLTFESGSTRPDIRGAAMLDRLAHLAQRCADSILEVVLAPETGTGAPAMAAQEAPFAPSPSAPSPTPAQASSAQVFLAQARAREIAAYLAEAGVDQDRIVVVPFELAAPADSVVAVQLRSAHGLREN